MNRLPLNKRIDVIAALVEGNSLRSIVRMTGVALNTVTKLLVDMGCACAAYHHGHVRDVRVRRLQCDEIWQFIGAKKKNVTPEQEQKGWGDSWTWTAMSMRRFTRLTNGFSKKLENHGHMVALYFNV